MNEQVPQRDRHDQHWSFRFYGPVILFIGTPFMIIVLFVFGAYCVTHWVQFVAILGYTPWVVGIVTAGAATRWVVIPIAKEVKHLIKPEPKVLTVTEHFMAFTGNGVQVHDHKDERTVNHNHVKVSEIPSDFPALPMASVPTFGQLLSQGKIQNALEQSQMIIGFIQEPDTNQWVVRYGSWLDLYSCAIAGVLGSGKTTTALFLLLQALLVGAQMILVDPHLHEPDESLAYRLRMFRPSMLFDPCDDTASDILVRVRWLSNEFKRRKALGIKGPTIILVLEEFNACMRNPDVAKEIADLLKCIEQEARKFGIFAILIGQYWSSQGIGGAVIRQCLASALVHRMSDLDQAKKLLGLPQHQKTALQLKQGHYVFKDTHGSYVETATPEIVESDLAEVARLLPANRFANSLHPVCEQFSEPLPDLAENPTKSKLEANTENQFDAALLARARDIIKLQAQNYQKPDVMKMLWGIAPSRSDAYKRAEAEYLKAMEIIHSMIGEEA